MKENEPVPFGWFTRSTLRYTPMIVELMIIAIVVRKSYAQGVVLDGPVAKDASIAAKNNGLLPGVATGR
jgi:hypothetical protein